MKKKVFDRLVERELKKFKNSWRKALAAEKLLP